MGGERPRVPAPEPGDAPPTNATRFRVGAEVARGGMGRVVAARDLRLGRPVAIKEALDADEATLRRFEREVQITARLQHPSIVPLYDAGHWPSGLPYYVMRLVSGRPLSERIAEARSLAERIALVPSFLAAADAIGFAHRHGIVHRDLKPANVLIGEHGETVVIDWGLAKVLDEDGPRAEDPLGDVGDLAPGAVSGALTALRSAGSPSPRAAPSPDDSTAPVSSTGAIADTMLDLSTLSGLPGEHPAEGLIPERPGKPPWGPATSALAERSTADAVWPGGPPRSSDAETRIGAVLGTPGYMAPEQAAGDPVDLTTDVYALGATLYHVLAGAPPLRSSRPAAALAEVLSGPPPPLAGRAPGAPAELLAIVDKAMAPERSARYPDASALAADLRRFLTGQLVAAHRYSTRDRIRRFVGRHRAALGVGGLAALVLSATVAAGLSRILSARERAERARADAVAGWHSAEEARQRASERADDLLLARARTALDGDPAVAAALMGRLPLESSRWADARAVLQAARARGIARALPGRRDLIGALDAAPSSRHLLSSDRRGVVEVHDLQRGTSRVVAEVERVSRAAWGDDGRTAVIATPGELFAVEVASGERRTIARPAEIVGLDRPDDASFIVWRDDLGDVFTAAPPAWSPVALARARGKGGWLQVSADGRLVSTSGQGEATALWRPGRREPLVTGERGCMVALHHAGDRAAFACKRWIDEWSLAGPRPVRLRRWPRRMGFSTVAYGGDVLFDLTGRGEVIALYPNGNSETLVTLGTGLFPFPTRSGLAVTTGSDAVVLIERGWMHTLRSSGARILRVAETPDGRTLVTGGSDGRLLRFDLGAVRPRRVPLSPGASRMIAVTHEAVVLATMSGEIERRDLATGAATVLGTLRTLAERSRSSPDGALVVVVSAMGEVAALRPRDGAFTVLADGGGSLAELVGSDRVVWERAGALWEQRPFSAEPARRVVGWSARVTAVASQDEWLAGALADGTLWRRAPGAGPDQIEKIAGGRVVGVIAVGRDGAVYAAVGREVWRWGRGALDRFATLTGPVFDLALDPALGLTASTGDGAVHLIGLTDGAVRTTALPTAGGVAELSLRGGRAAAMNGANQPLTVDIIGGLVDVLEPRWALAVATAADGAATAALLSPGELLVETHDLPRAPAALRAWLTAATNATVDDGGAVAWP